ncbi:uncharacterized protein LOC110092094 [Dendrobium catenatum]|uniref:uncharacterized protein LOC110092094 n=1 Tax=Dendrobium catenatum TaxID=906689 RepID=UPI0009F66196|nr:uncharacterized protein LOC110092094 [Dendrobium catenatum]
MDVRAKRDGKNWSALGPFYEALLGAIKKTWSLSGSVQLLSLNDGFFLFRFSCREDFDIVWSRGVWFLLRKPFIFQKWHPKFIPKREEFSSVPIWVKIHDLPLAYWNSEGRISRIASKIGIPVVADKLTEQKARLTYARICVLVDNLTTFPEVIHVSLDGDDVSLKVQYEWHPFPCDHCKSLMHFASSCPSKPQHGVNDNAKAKEVNRGRSFSRQARYRAKSKPQNRQSEVNVDNPEVAKTITEPSSQTKAISTNALGQPLHYHPHSPTPKNSPFKTDVIIGNIPLSKPHFSEDAIVSGIPNLNSPH